MEHQRASDSELGMTGKKGGRRWGRNVNWRRYRVKGLGGQAAGLIAGFDASTAPGTTEHGSPTLCNVCTRRRDDHIP